MPAFGLACDFLPGLTNYISSFIKNTNARIHINQLSLPTG